MVYKQEKEADKKEKDAREAKYKLALVDGRKEQVCMCWCWLCYYV